MMPFALCSETCLPCSACPPPRRCAQVHYVEIDIEEDPDIGQSAGVQGTPTVQVRACVEPSQSRWCQLGCLALPTWPPTLRPHPSLPLPALPAADLQGQGAGGQPAGREDEAGVQGSD